MDYITIGRDVLVGGAALTTGIVAILGLRSWHRELRGKADFETARSLIRATYKLRDALSDARSPNIFPAEYPEGYRSYNNDNTNRERSDAHTHVYENRLKLLNEARQGFDAYTLEAEALWGKNIKLKADNLIVCITRFEIAISIVSVDILSAEDVILSDNAVNSAESDLMRNNKNDDALSIKIANAVSAIEEMMRPHLKRK